MRVDDVMTRDVRTVRSDTPLKQAARLMVELRVSGLPVVDSAGHVLGVVSESDILMKEAGPPGKPSFLERILIGTPANLVDPTYLARSAGEAMSAPAITIGARRSVSEAASTMIDHRVNRLPVVDDEGSLLGIVTRADLVRAFVRSDEAITREIREDVLRRALWIEPDAIEVEVEDGEVRLSGEVETKSDAELIPTLVQRVPGVIAVLSKLRWRDEAGRSGGRLLV